jgi:parallel beta-helix repeat protein
MKFRKGIGSAGGAAHAHAAGTRRQFLRRALLALPMLVASPAAWMSASVAAENAPARKAPTRARGPARIDVRDKGARGDGKHDDTAAFQAAIDALPASGGTVHVPTGTYLIDAVAAVNLRSRMHLELAREARLVAMPNGEKKYRVLCLLEVSDVEISGGGIQGERAGHLDSAGEWGHGIHIRGSSRVTVRDMRIADCWGDGVCIGGAGPRRATPSEDIVIAGIVSTGNRRQGLSIGRSRKVRVYDSEFSNTSGTNPQYGIDIEPDKPGGASDIRIENCLVRNNRGGGIQIYKRVTDVTIKDCTIENNGGRGILAVGAIGGLITGNRIRGNGLVGVAVAQQSTDFQVRDNRFDGNDAKHPGRAKLRPAVKGLPESALHVGDDTTGVTVSGNRHEGR